MPIRSTLATRLAADQLEEVRTRLAQRPPDAVLTAAEAAIYTGRSSRTLKRAIDAGVGPRREKNPDVSGLAATNRHTRYRKGDLDTWRESLLGFGTGFRTFDDLAADAPWLVDGGRIVGHLLDLDGIEAILTVLQEDAVVFLRLDEALREPWAAMERRKGYQEVFTAICERAAEGSKVAGERACMEEETGAALGERSLDRL